MLRKYNLDIILIVIFICVMAYIVYYYFIVPSKNTKNLIENLTMEHFDNKKAKNNDKKKKKLKSEDVELYQAIIDIYHDILQVNPTPSELMGFFEKVKHGVIDLEELKYQLNDELRQMKRINLTGLSKEEPKPKTKKIIKKKKVNKQTDEKKSVDDYNLANELDKDIAEERVIRINKTGEYSNLFDKDEEFIKKHLKELDESEQKKKALIIQNPVIYNVYNSDNNSDTKKETTIDKLSQLNAADISKIVYDEDGNLNAEGCKWMYDKSRGYYDKWDQRNFNEVNYKCKLASQQTYDDMLLRDDQKSWQESWPRRSNSLHCNLKDKEKCDTVMLPTETSLIGTFIHSNDLKKK